jgi:hypothetical protein
MILLVCADGETEPMGRFIRGMPGLSASIRVVTYRTLFASRSVPVAHYIFTDHDRLSPEDLERAAALASAITTAARDAQVLNHPLEVLERYAFVRALYTQGLGGFDMVRLDEPRLPRFPAFIRREAGTGRAETPVLRNGTEFTAALADLGARGLAKKGRVAVEFVDTRSADGRYRKYGVLRIGDRFVAQHLFVADEWCVKGQVARFAADAAAEELAFVQSALLEPELRRVFDVARIQYGRLDYGLRNGRLLPFEINTNPSLPRPGDGDLRAARRALVAERIVQALRELDRPLAARGAVRLPDGLRWPGPGTRLNRKLREIALRTPMADWHFRRRRRRRFPP